MVCVYVCMYELIYYNLRVCLSFLNQCKNLKLYKDTVEMYRRSLECLESRKTDINFKRFLEVRRHSSAPLLFILLSLMISLLFYSLQDVRLTVTTLFKDIPNVNGEWTYMYTFVYVF